MNERAKDHYGLQKRKSNLSSVDNNSAVYNQKDCRQVQDKINGISQDALMR